MPRHSKESRIANGLAGTREYHIWSLMKRRCNNINDKDYGAKGITVCEEWLNFEAFYKWANENGYDDNLTLDRKDPTKGYFPDNCQWLTRSENAQKAHYDKAILKRHGKFIPYDFKSIFVKGNYDAIANFFEDYT